MQRCNICHTDMSSRRAGAIRFNFEAGTVRVQIYFCGVKCWDEFRRRQAETQRQQQQRPVAEPVAAAQHAQGAAAQQN